MASQSVKAPVPSSSSAGIHATVKGTSCRRCWRLPAVVTTASLSSWFTADSMELEPSGSSRPTPAMLEGGGSGRLPSGPVNGAVGDMEPVSPGAARPPGGGSAGAGVVADGEGEGAAIGEGGGSEMGSAGGGVLGAAGVRGSSGDAGERVGSSGGMKVSTGAGAGAGAGAGCALGFLPLPLPFTPLPLPCASAETAFGLVCATAGPATSPTARQRAKGIRRSIPRFPERTQAAIRRGQLMTVECIILTSASGAAFYVS
jgi:hypothetical protein